jgi:hypothetical protein
MQQLRAADMIASRSDEMEDRQAHKPLIDFAAGARPGPASRRHALLDTAKLAGGGMLGLAIASASLGRGVRSVLAQEVDVSTPVGVLNYALTLEQLEATFYREGLEGFAPGDFDEGVFDNLVVIRDHELDHVETLTATITQLGGTPVGAAEYAFADAFDDAQSFLTTAQALENTGVGAYTGAAQFLIADDALLTAALTIHGVEARHASYLNRLTGASPFPNAVDPPLTPNEVLTIATPFFATDVASGDVDEATGGTTTVPATGSGGIYQSGGDGAPDAMLALLGSAAAGAAAVAALRRRAAAHAIDESS